MCSGGGPFSHYQVGPAYRDDCQKPASACQTCEEREERMCPRKEEWWQCKNCQADLREVGMEADLERLGNAKWKKNEGPLTGHPLGGVFSIQTMEQTVTHLRCGACGQDVTKQIEKSGAEVYH